MAMRQETIEGGFPVWVNEQKSKPLLDEAYDQLDDSFSNRMGYLCQPKKLRFNLRSAVKCRKTEKRERLAKGKPLFQKTPDYDEEPNYEEDSGYEEQFYEEPKESIFKKTPKKVSGRGLGPAPRKPGLWR
jgi:hypothetical protein